MLGISRTVDRDPRYDIVEVRLEILAPVRDLLEEAAQEVGQSPSVIAEAVLYHHLKDWVGRARNTRDELSRTASDAGAEDDSIDGESMLDESGHRDLTEVLFPEPSEGD